MFFIEFLATSIFVSMVLAVKFYNGSKDSVAISAGVMAITLYGSISLTMGLTGSSLNPAYGLI